MNGKALYELQELAGMVLPIVVGVITPLYSKLKKGQFNFSWVPIMYAVSAVALQWYIPLEHWLVSDLKPALAESFFVKGARLAMMLIVCIFIFDLFKKYGGTVQANIGGKGGGEDGYWNRIRYLGVLIVCIALVSPLAIIAMRLSEAINLPLFAIIRDVGIIVGILLFAYGVYEQTKRQSVNTISDV